MTYLLRVLGSLSLGLGLLACDPGADADAGLGDGGVDGGGVDGGGVDGGGVDSGFDAGYLDAGEQPPIPPPDPEPCPLRDASAFTLVGHLPEPTHQSMGIVVDDWLYVFPSRSGTETWLAPIGSDGTPGAFVRGAPLPAEYLDAGRPVRVRDRIYVTGGYIARDVNPAARAAEVVSGLIDDDGVVRSWSFDVPMNRTRANHGAVAVGDVIVVFGGETAGKGTSTEAIEVTWRVGDSLGPWSIVHEGLSTSVAFPGGAVRVGDHVYYGSPSDSGRLPLSGFGPFEELPGFSGREMLAARGRTVLAASQASLVRFDVATDGVPTEPVELAPLPPTAGDGVGIYRPASLAVGPRFVYALGGFGRGEASDEVWMAPLCAD